MHQWILAGPWYRWEHPGKPSSGRASRPVFQKYDTPKLVEEFLRDPQHSLVFDDEDTVHEVRALPALVPPTYKGHLRRLAKNSYASTGVRKLFLDTHKRFYLIVCELHCDEVGFPNVLRSHACEAGFVVRRRVVPSVPLRAATQAQGILANIAQARVVVGQLDPVARDGLEPVARTGATSMLSTEKARLAAWARTWGIATRLEGWSAKADRIGEWVTVEETPAEVHKTEQVFPLYPLVPDPRDAKHSGRGRTIYFGLVPTGSADTDDVGTARFDPANQYEIRSFVRRHDLRCPRRSQAPDCHGPLFWGAATEPYRLAAHFDLVGTSKRPVSVQLPDLGALEAQAAALPPNQLAPFRMVAPTNSNLEVTADGSGTITGHDRTGRICSFSIPLVTIVATFVFKLFLPVVTLLFGLFFLLKLRFCIPPDVSVPSDVLAELSRDAQVGPDEASKDSTFDAGDPALIGQHLHDALAAGFGEDMTTGLEQTFAPGVLAGMAADVAGAADPANAPSLTANLRYEAHVDPEPDL
jgi:hypothetical protein